MEPSTEALSIRISRLNKLLLGRPSSRHFLDIEGLLDSLLVLYDECNNDYLKKDRNIASFVEKFCSTVSELRQLRVNIEDFEVKKVIGRGHFGEVRVVREKQTGDTYAMKTLCKADTLNQHAIAFYQEERDIMANAKSPWLTSLQYAFQDAHHLYLVMEFHPGGDLLALLERFDGILTEDVTRFYLAELVLAIRSLHNMGYVHRDIKPENILIDRCGHLKLADFGSAVKLTPAGTVMSYLPVGTPEYIAPEVLQAMNQPRGKQQSYGVECDYWSLGIVAYEMVVGQTPFSGEQLMLTYNNIMNHHNSLHFPANCEASQLFRKLVGGLLEDASVRFTYEKLLKHEFFNSINWNSLHDMVPPFVPVVNGVDDTSNFVEFEHEMPPLSIKNFRTRKEFSGKDLPFIGFTYTHDVRPQQAVCDSPRKDQDLQSVLFEKKKEIEELHFKLKMAEETYKCQEMVNLKQKLEEYTCRLEMVELDRSELEDIIDRNRKEVECLKRKLQFERQDRKASEKQAVSIIWETKAKWEQCKQRELGELKKEIQKWKGQLREQMLYKDTLEARLQQVAEELEESRVEVQRLQGLLSESQGKVVKACEQSRLSVVGVESQLERIASENQHQLHAIQQSLNAEMKLRSEAEAKILKIEAETIQKGTELSVECGRLRSEKLELQHNLDRSEQRCMSLEAKSKEEANKAELSEKMVLQLQEHLEIERRECQELKAQLASLEGQLSESLLSLQHESTQAARLQERESQVVALEEELKKSCEERMELQRCLQAATEKDYMAHKVNDLEELLSVLQQTSCHLENENVKLKERISELGSSQQNVLCTHADANNLMQQKAFLESQVKKLEEQLEKLRGKLVLERDAAKAAQYQLFKKEKELSDAKIDIRIAQREARATEEEVKGLQEEQKKWSAKIQADKTAHAQELKANLEKMERLRDEQSELRSHLDRQQSQEMELSLELEAKKAALADKTHELEACQVQLQAVCSELEAMHQNVVTVEKHVASLQGQVTQLSQTCDQSREDRDRLATELQEHKSRYAALELNTNALKEACTILEEQLEGYDSLVTRYAEKEKTVTAAKAVLEKEVEKLQGEIRLARQATNEERSLRICAETRLQQAKADLAAEVENVSGLQRQVKDYKNLAENLTRQVTELDDKYGSAELSLRTVNRQMEAKDAELANLKEELSQQLTQIHSLRESNFKLSHELEEAVDNCKILNGRLLEMEATMEELQVFHKHREIKTDATLQQQTKLIDFLQRSLSQQNKKKKTLTDKLFGSRQKENVAPTPLYQDLEAALVRERNKVKNLTEQLNQVQSMMIKGDSGAETIKKSMLATLNTQCAFENVMQLPGSQVQECFERQPSTQNTHHDKPHRFKPKLCMHATKCPVCLDSIRFGRHAVACLECNVMVHPKCCSLVMPTTCGLPSDFTDFHKTWNSSQSSLSSTDTECKRSSSRMEGYVKLARRNRTGWERKFLRLNGSCLEVLENSDKNAEPISRFEVCPPEGTTSVLSAVPYSDIVNTAKSDIPYILKVEVSPRTACWSGRSMLIMALSFPDKQQWVQALEAVVQGQHCDAISQYKGHTLAHLEKPLDLNCVLQLSEKLLLLGAEEGLFSLSLKGKPEDAALVQIQGVSYVHQIATVPQLGMAIMIAGKERTLQQCNYPSLQSCARAAACSEPTISLQALLPSNLLPDSFHLFAVSKGAEPSQQQGTVLCAATLNKLIILQWNASQQAFAPSKLLDTCEPCSCIHFSSNFILVGCNKFFKIDLQNLSVEPFLDSTDKTLAHAVFGTQQLNSFPVAIIEVSNGSEYLLCFNEFGVFVDERGQRKRDDIKWSYLPFAFAFRSPYLFIIHFASVEVIQLSSSAFKRKNEDANSIVNFPDQIFIELSNPRYLGPAGSAGSIFMRNGLDILMLEGSCACKDDLMLSTSSLDTDRDGADLNDGSSMFSFTQSLIQSLESEGSPCSETNDTMSTSSGAALT